MTTPIDFDSQADRLEKLEREHRNLLTRLERLEKRRASLFTALLGNVLLLVLAGLIADYLGLLPRPVERLPLEAKRVHTEEVILVGEDGKPAGRIHLVKGRVTLSRYDQAGGATDSEPLGQQP